MNCAEHPVDFMKRISHEVGIEAKTVAYASCAHTEGTIVKYFSTRENAHSRLFITLASEYGMRLGRSGNFVQHTNYSLKLNSFFSKKFHNGLLDFAKISAATLENYAPHVGIELLFLWSNNDPRSSFKLVGNVEAMPDKNGEFTLRIPDKVFYYPDSNETTGNKDLEGKLADITSIKDDYRPYVHRILEMHASISPEHWHNPEIYAASNSRGVELKAVVERGLDILFSGKEREDIQAKMHSGLQTGQEWVSIPHLTLGMKKLPSPGANCLDYEFLSQTAPLLLEYVSTLGIMPEEVITQRLVNYFVQSSGFQLSAQRARDVLRAISSESAQEAVR